MVVSTHSLTLCSADTSVITKLICSMCIIIIIIIALFIFNTKEAAEKFVAEDPYVSNGIVTNHSILEWSVVVGSN